MHPALQAVVGEFSRKVMFDSAAAVLAWDQETHMPEGSGRARADQLSLLASAAHEAVAGERFLDLLGRVVDPKSGDVIEPALDPLEQTLAREIWRDWRHEACLPADFVAEFSKLTSLAQQEWIRARERADFSLFSPRLERIVAMSREKASLLGVRTTPYDALLDLYEPEATTAALAGLFGPLRTSLTGLLQRIVERGRPVDAGLLFQRFEPEKQWAFGLRVLGDIGFDSRRGRQDRSAHPFTTSFHPDDVRITTRVHEHDLRSALFGTIHEAGHALYEQGLDPTWFGTPFGMAISLGIHESQSRLWENLVARGRPFWRHYLPLLRDHFPAQLAGVDPDRFFRAVNEVRPSLIRVEADEVTYHLHVMLRFELEQALINDGLPVSELPAAWDARMGELLGIRPETVRDGVLQDVHWSMGAIGYFPTYTLGTLASVQLMRRAQQELPDLDDDFAAGRFDRLRGWLGDRIHRFGRQKTADRLLRDVTGGPLSADPFIAYVEAKYADVYQL